MYFWSKKNELLISFQVADKNNFIEILYGFYACDMNQNYGLYKDKTVQTISIINLFVSEFRLIAMSDVYAYILNLKRTVL